MNAAHDKLPHEAAAGRALESSPTTDEEPSDAVVRNWLAERTGTVVENWRRLLIGNSRSTWSADLVNSNGRTAVIVRHDDGVGPMAGTELTLAREATVYRALAGFDPVVPTLLASDDRTVVLTRLPGGPGWDESVLDGLLQVLARLHQVPVVELALPGFAPTACADLDLWKRIAGSTVQPRDPVLDLAFAVLAEHFPGEPERTVLCHGDAGVGNVLVADGKLGGVVDWEFAHIGDPIDDLAWITVRAVLNGVPLDGFETAVVRYSAASGVPLDDRRLAYWQAAVIMRNLVCCDAAISAPDSGQDKLIYFMLVTSLRSMLTTALARVAGVTLDPTPPLPAPAAPLPGQAEMAEVARQVHLLVDELTDSDQALRGKRVRLLLSQLAVTWPLAAEAARLDAEAGASKTDDLAGQLRRLAARADRELQLFPRAARMTQVPLAGFPSA